MTISQITGTDTLRGLDADGKVQAFPTVATAAIDPATGAPATFLPPGRAAAAASVPVVLSNEDFARLAGTYNRATAIGATPGNAVLVYNVTTAGTITLTLATGSVTINVPLGSTILPFGATAAALGTAVGGSFQSLFYV